MDMDNNNSGLLPVIGMKAFPDIIDGKLDLNYFLLASGDLVALVGRLGPVFAPVKIDMDGNIAKIWKAHHIIGSPCLFQLMTEERDQESDCATVGVLWLNRAFLFFEITFKEILELLQQDKKDVKMTKIFTIAYEGSVKKYHNWISQRLFHLICKVSPNLETTLKSLGMTDKKGTFISDLAAYTETLSCIRKHIDKYFIVNKLFIEKNDINQ